jgi:sortase B
MKRKITFLDFVIVLLVLVIAFSAFMIVKTVVRGKREQSEFDELANLIVEVAPDQTPNEPDAPAAPTETVRDISAVLSANSDCVGWIFVNGTVINYPVMHTPSNPEKYLHLSFYGGETAAGTPFMDARCSVGGMNTIIYAHNMKNGTMFHQLKRYRNRQYTADNPIIEFQTADGTRKFRVFSVCEVDGKDPWYSFIGEVDKETYKAKIEYIKSKDIFESGITPVYPQKLITLSTCKDGTDSGRIIVIGVEE